MIQKYKARLSTENIMFLVHASAVKLWLLFFFLTLKAKLAMFYVKC